MSDGAATPPGSGGPETWPRDASASRRRLAVRAAAGAAVLAIAASLVPLCTQGRQETAAQSCGRYLDLVDDMADRSVTGRRQILARVRDLDGFDAGTRHGESRDRLVSALEAGDGAKTLEETRRLAFLCVDIAER